MNEAERLDATELLCWIAASWELLDDASAKQVKKVLETQVATPPTASRRLGLLIRACLLEGDGYVTEETYETHRARDKEEDWPDATTLARSYGYWARAVSHAAHHARFGPLRGSGHRDARWPRQSRYEPREIINALEAARHSLGHWPIRGEYIIWRQVRIKGARNSGQQNPRLPSISTFWKVLGSYENAVAAAKEADERYPREEPAA